MAFQESMFQQSCVRWFRMNYPKHVMNLFAIPNGAHLGGKTPIARAKQWNRLEREGCVSGVADLFLMSQPGVFIEMKFEKGKQSDNQKAFEVSATKAGYDYALCNDYEIFKEIIIQYLGYPKLDMIAKSKYDKKYGQYTPRIAGPST